MVVLDTNFLISVEKGEVGAHALHERMREALVVFRVPAAVWVEYLCGFDASLRMEAAQRLGSAVQFEPFDRGIADRAAGLQKALLSNGVRLGWHDLQVAATALHHGEPLVTRDDRFSVVAELEIYRW